MDVNSIGIRFYRQFAKVIPCLPKQDFWTAFDAEADVLYVNFC